MYGEYDNVGISGLFEDLSNDMWTQSIDEFQTGDDFWLAGHTDLANELYVASENSEWLSTEAYEASWEAYYGPVNSEGYTAYDASMGYTSTDTSFIEPATSASSMSMISDNSASSWL